ncbi:MAG: acyltransferase [Acidimicrobiales bacterium]
MFNHEYAPSRLRDRLRTRAYALGGPLVRRSWELYKSVGAIGPHSAAGRRFGSLGEGSIVCFPYDTMMNVDSIHIGAGTMISGHVALSAGWGPNHPGISPRIVVIGDRCLIGRGSSVVGHRYIEIGDDVWTGHNVHITDMNHGYTDIDLPISVQNQPEDPVHIGAGSWLGHNTVVLPGVTIGRHVVVGAGSVVTSDLPDFSVAVGAPARVIRYYDATDGWKAAGPHAVTASLASV